MQRNRLLRWLSSGISQKHPADKNSERFTGIGTVLFFDMVGFASLAEGSDPLSIISAMNRVTTVVSEAIRKHQGILPSSQSDAGLAYWRPSPTSPSHAELALNCGGQILREISRLQSEEAISPGVRMALGTGDMTGDFIAGRFQIVGRACATAKRLMDFKLPRTTSLLCTPETLALLSKSVTPQPAKIKIQRSTGEEIDVHQFFAQDFG